MSGRNKNTVVLGNVVTKKIFTRVAANLFFLINFPYQFSGDILFYSLVSFIVFLFFCCFFLFLLVCLFFEIKITHSDSHSTMWASE